MEQMNNHDVACFEVNEHGRILSGNKRFCRMFGYEEAELIWHYITDFYRYAADWESYKNCDDEGERNFIVRMRNRKGRSFNCNIRREVSTDADGKIRFRNTVCRVDDSVVAKSVSETPIARKVLYVAKCTKCGNHVRVNSLAETRMRVLCDGCASKVFPEAFGMKTAQQ